MAIVETLPAYVDQVRDTLLRKSMLGSKTAKLFTLQTGVKNVSALNILDTAAILQDGAACGWNEAGTSTLSQRLITAPTIKVNMSFCAKKLQNTALQHQVRVAAGQQTLPFEESFIEGVIDSVSAQVEKLIWQGDTASLDALLKLADGMLKILVADVPAGNKITDTLVAFNAAPITKMARVVAAIPVEDITKTVIYVGYDIYRTYILALQAGNLYHNAGDGLDAEGITYQGSNIKIIPVGGLNGTNKIVAMSNDNAFYGVDMLSDSETFDFWFSKDAQEFRLAIEFNSGTQTAFPDRVILYTLT